MRGEEKEKGCEKERIEGGERERERGERVMGRRKRV